jgi:hypothetical protein
MTAPTQPRASTPRPVQRWGSLPADVVEADRDEHVGGRRHVRPAVAVR